MSMQAVGAYLRRLREQQGLTMAQVAQQAQVAPNYVWRIEAAQVKEPGFASLVSLIRAVGGSADDVADILLNQLSTEDALQRAEQQLAPEGALPTAAPVVSCDDELSLLLRTLRKTFATAHGTPAQRAFLRALQSVVNAWRAVDGEPTQATSTSSTP